MCPSAGDCVLTGDVLYTEDLTVEPLSVFGMGKTEVMG